MASKSDLYISVSPEFYRKGKSAVLKSKSHTLVSLKHLRNLKVLARKKRDLKIYLSKLVSSTLTEIDSFQEKIPEKNLPKFLEKKSQKNKFQEKIEKYDSIDTELKVIQEKLRLLNSY